MHKRFRGFGARVCEFVYKECRHLNVLHNSGGVYSEPLHSASVFSKPSADQKTEVAQELLLHFDELD